MSATVEKTLPNLPFKIPPRDGSRIYRQDDRSRQSVRDKIAMFSSQNEISKHKTRKVDRSESVKTGQIKNSLMKRSLTEDDIRYESCRNSSQLDDHSKSINTVHCIESNLFDSKKSIRVENSKISITSLQSEEMEFETQNVNLNDVNGLSKNEYKPKLPLKYGLQQNKESLKLRKTKRNSAGAFDRPSCYKYGIENPEIKERRISLNNLIEQKRKKVAKIHNKIYESPDMSPLSKINISSNSSFDSIKTNSKSKFYPPESEMSRNASKNKYLHTSFNADKDTYITDNSMKINEDTHETGMDSLYDNQHKDFWESNSCISSRSSFEGNARILQDLSDFDDLQSDSCRQATNTLSFMSNDMCSTEFKTDITDVNCNNFEGRKYILKSSKQRSGSINREKKDSTTGNGMYYRDDNKRNCSISSVKYKSPTGSLHSNSSSSHDGVAMSSITSYSDDICQSEVYNESHQHLTLDNYSINTAYINEIEGDEQFYGDFEFSRESPILNQRIAHNICGDDEDLISEYQMKHYKERDEESNKCVEPLTNVNCSPLGKKCIISNGKSGFQSISSKWKGIPSIKGPQEENTTSMDISQQHKPIFKNLSSSNMNKYSKSNEIHCYEVMDSQENICDTSTNDIRPHSLNVSQVDVFERKFSAPECMSTLKQREKNDICISSEYPSRPTSLTEPILTLTDVGPQIEQVSTSFDSKCDSMEAHQAAFHQNGRSKDFPDILSKSGMKLAGISSKMSDIIRAFEMNDLTNKSSNNNRILSIETIASDDGSQGTHYGSVSSLASGQRDQFGSITSLSSSTSIISPQELAQLIEEANQSLEESGTPSHEILVVVLHREIVGHGSIGITLAGGADYETKEITVHKIIPGGLADRDGRVKKCDRILSINGKSLRGVSHREALNILKSPRPEVVLVLSRSRSVTPQDSNSNLAGRDPDSCFNHRSVFINHIPPARPPKILESPMDSKSLVSDMPIDISPRGPPINVNLVKEGAGLGFSLEGGKDSPLGDRPLTVKKVFSGGSADKEGTLKIGDELLKVNSVDLTNMARIEAWNFLKKLPDGKVTLVIRKEIKEDAKEGCT